MSDSWLRQTRMAGRSDGPPFLRMGARTVRYLPTDLSTREIADELYLSVHTIKTHVKHLYAKLDAHSRRDAVKRARELGLLSQSLRNR